MGTRRDTNILIQTGYSILPTQIPIFSSCIRSTIHSIQTANSCPRTNRNLIFLLFIPLSLLYSTWIWLYSMRSFYWPYVPVPVLVPCSVPAGNILTVSHNQIVPCGKSSVCFTHPSRCSLFLSLGKYTSNLFCSDPLDVPCSIPLYYSPLWMFPIPSPRKMFCFFHSSLWIVGTRITNSLVHCFPLMPGKVAIQF